MYDIVYFLPDHTACTLKLRLVKLLREGGMFAVTGGFPFTLIDAFQRTITYIIISLKFMLLLNKSGINKQNTPIIFYRLKIESVESINNEEIVISLVAVGSILTGHIFFPCEHTRSSQYLNIFYSNNEKSEILSVAGISGPLCYWRGRHIWSPSETVAGIYGPQCNYRGRHIWSPL